MTIINEIPVVFAANDNYVPYLGVAIQSLLSCCDERRTYSVFILYTAITDENRERLERLSTKNVTVRCRDVTKEMEGINIAPSFYHTAETVYRLLIPMLFSQYDKVLYLDCDLVVLRDVAHLYETDLESNVLGAVRSVMTDSIYNYISPLNLAIPYQDYFNAGVLLINTKRYIEQEIMQECFQLLRVRHRGTVLNVIKIRTDKGKSAGSKASRSKNEMAEQHNMPEKKEESRKRVQQTSRLRNLQKKLNISNKLCYSVDEADRRSGSNVALAFTIRANGQDISANQSFDIAVGRIV